MRVRQHVAMNHDPSSSPEPDILARSHPWTQPLASTTKLVTDLTSLLTFVCSRTVWEYGEAWIPDVTRSTLELSPAWCITADLDVHRAISWMQFQVCSRAFVLCSGEGMPGRVWQSRQSEWLDNVSAQSETYFLRNQIARALNVRAGLGIPMIVNSQVLAVIVFFMSKERSLDPELISHTQAIIRDFQHEFFNRPLD